ncbi:hypothetical protein N9268_02525 [Akkermansiaceae bacterium]|nr:hypothetical protein [Akkermansiaceae bacterium]MDA8967301.1 hypothetical protein [Akkermansiaceae bacterium]MDB4421832.1 hypothetical protein [Akkermansiaceae bacterium]MDB4545664.1 hypothetical protein [Akkermansiaceae bacterium]
MKSIRIAVGTFFVVWPTIVLAAPPCTEAVKVAPNFNALVLSAITKMPKKGNYATNRDAAVGLRNSMVYRGGKLVVNAKHALPSFCSGATYLAFLYAVKEAENKGLVKLNQTSAVKLLARGQADGSGVWGRWNANGPGTAGLFHETGIGINFESYDRAQAGDFMKIFWNDEIGKKERGHSVIYLGRDQKDGETRVRFWSSNQPDGYGEKAVPISKIKWAIFSRITRPQNVVKVSSLPANSQFLSDMLSKSFTTDEVRKKVGIQ